MSRSKDAWADWGAPAEERDDRPPGGFVVFDTETTGTRKVDRLVEIAAVHLAQGREAGRWSSLVNPEMDIPRDAQRVHGISDYDVRDAPLAGPALCAFGRFVGARPLVAHNASFDARMLRADAARTGAWLPAVDVLCTLKVARRVLAGDRKPRGGHGLPSLAEHYRVRVTTAHRAMADVLTLVAVLRHLMADPGAAGRSLRDLHGPAELLAPMAQTDTRTED